MSLATDLPLIQELTYNGHRFNGSTHTQHYSVKPHLSACGRFFTHSDFLLTVSTWLHNNDPAAQDDAIENLVTTLTAIAAPLSFKARSLGDVSINLPGGPRDVSWGPKPSVDSIENFGGSLGTRVTWTVAWATTTCADGVTAGGFPLEFVWDVAFKIDKSGLTTRVVSGSLTVPATRANPRDRRLPFSADELRERIEPALIPGYRRTPGEFKLDYAKTKLTFSFEDVQFPAAVPPPNVIEAAGKHTLAQTAGKPYEWTATLPCEYEIAHGATVKSALEAFFATLKDRWDAVRKGQVIGPAGIPLKVIPVAFTLDDAALYDKQRVGITCTYRIIGGDIRTMLARGGLWRPIPKDHNDWKKWSRSVENHLSPRGVSNIVFSVNDDRIVDMCEPVPVKMELRGGPRPRPGTSPSDLITGGAAAIANGLLTGTVLSGVRGYSEMFPPPTPFDSWLDYRCAIHFEDESGVIVGSTLPAAPLTKAPADSAAFNVLTSQLPAGAPKNYYTPTDKVVPSGGSLQADFGAARGGTFAQRRTVPQVFVTISGHAVRHGFPVPVPALESVDGNPVVPCNRIDRGEGFQSVVAAADAAGTPIHTATWRLRYAVTSGTTTESLRTAVPIVPNPLMKVLSS